jgi:hypothetical protein
VGLNLKLFQEPIVVDVVVHDVLPPVAAGLERRTMSVSNGAMTSDNHLSANGTGARLTIAHFVYWIAGSAVEFAAYPSGLAKPAKSWSGDRCRGV